MDMIDSREREKKESSIIREMPIWTIDTEKYMHEI